MEGNGPGVGEVVGAGDDADQPLLDLLDALVNERGPTGAAEALGVNYRTVARCQQSRRVSRRMREVLEEFRDSQYVGDDEPGVGVGGDVGEDVAETQEDLAAALEQEHRELQETVEAQAAELEVLRRRVAELEERAQITGEDVAVDGGQGQVGEWGQPRRGHGLPDAGVVTLDEQPDEEDTLGPAVPLVAEWRRVRTGGDQTSSRVDRAVAAVRRWELEVQMLREFRLTLPPETEPLDESRRRDQLRWREEALAEARQELRRANRARLLMRLMTLGLLRK